MKRSAQKSKNSSEQALRPPAHNSEKALDTVDLDHEVPQEFRETTVLEENTQTDTSKNWSQAEDRSEDLINETDPFIQQAEYDTQVPPELVQERAYHLFEQRGGGSGDNLADWFEAERQLRQEHTLHSGR